MNAQRRRAGAIPRATCRLQLNAGFTFRDAEAILPYLAALGISHLYLSPIQLAQPGSAHGYDIADHTAISPELGGEAGFERLTAAMLCHGLGLLLDIVPNHAGVGGARNPLWLSCLEWGEDSPHAQVFDIDWRRPGTDGRVVLPFLGRPYAECLRAGNIKLGFDADAARLGFWHHEHYFPLRPADYPAVLDLAAAALPREASALRTRVIALAETFRRIEDAPAAMRVAAADAGCKALRQLAFDKAILEAIAGALHVLNGVPGEPESFMALHRLLEHQNYRLAYWRTLDGALNYRRFFEVTGLAGLRIEKEEVFEMTHRSILSAVASGQVQGLRVDHVDGLADPRAYLERLRRSVGDDLYIVVEKILGAGESLRPEWPVDGTTGYEALGLLDGIFVDEAGEPAFDAVELACGGPPEELPQIKAWLLERAFRSERDALVQRLHALAGERLETRDITGPQIERALTGLCAQLPVYRTYLDAGPVSQEDRVLLEDAAARVCAAPDFLDREAIAFLLDIFLRDTSGDVFGRAAGKVRRLFQQLTGPLMAKGLEDTLFYRDARFIAANEVGAHPRSFAVPLPGFHAAMQDRAARQPHGLTPTATHDTKRGEDMRARLAVLSEMPDAWRDLARRVAMTSPDAEAPDARDRLFLLQTIVGAAPAGGFAQEDFPARLTDYIRKALREAKRHTHWTHPDETYEQRAIDWAMGLLDDAAPVAAQVRSLIARIAFPGSLNSLSRCILKCTVPGVPDIYQGCEFPDFALVDPDNRRPVDYAAREASLAQGHRALDDASAKQMLLRLLLADRAAAPDLYAFGDYQPLSAIGTDAARVIAFSRNHADGSRIIVTTRFFASLATPADWPVQDWRGTSVPLPDGAWVDVLTGNEFSGQAGLSSLVQAWPGVVLRRVED